jgi:hypothetical protein
VTCIRSLPNNTFVDVHGRVVQDHGFYNSIGGGPDRRICGKPKFVLAPEQGKNNPENKELILPSG